MSGAGEALVRVALNYASLIKDIGRGAHGFRDLAEDDARALFAAMLADEVPPLELGAILMALRIKGEALAETIGFMRALDAHVGLLEPPLDRPRPVILPSYNGARRQPNLTALVALLLKRYGVPVLVHGVSGVGADLANDNGESGDTAAAATNRVTAVNGARYGRITTAEVLCALGILPATSLADAQSRLDRENIAYVPIGVLAPGLAQMLSYRGRLGVRSSAHSLATLIDPFAGQGYRVVSVSHPDDLTRMRAFLAATGADALLLRSTEGEPFANPRRQPQLEHFARGVASIYAEAETGTLTLMPPLPAMPDATGTAEWIAGAVSGEHSVPAPIVTQLGCCLYGAHRQTAEPGSRSNF